MTLLEEKFPPDPVESFDQYHALARSTAIYPSGKMIGILYCALKLNGEAGEVAEKVGKVLRDSNGEFSEAIKLHIALELGDVLWYVSNLAHEVGFDLRKIANINVRKLQDRQRRGTLHGSGDER